MNTLHNFVFIKCIGEGCSELFRSKIPPPLYYTKILHTNSRDAIHILDGLFHHGTNLNIEEHYTGTAGYTDQIFGLTHLLGFKFAPRIRDLSDSKLFTIDKASEYPKL